MKSRGSIMTAKTVHSHVNIKHKSQSHAYGALIRMIPAALLALCLLTGCVAGESEQKKAGTQLMKAYFEETGKKATLQGVYADVTRPAADRLEMSDYVKGTYKLGEQTYDFWVNVETGSIYTSERMQEFSSSILKLQAEKLGLDFENAACTSSITMPPSFTGETGNSRGQEDEVTLTDVLPVTVTDMDAFVKDVLEREDVFVHSNIICRKVPAGIGDGQQPEVLEWKNDQITISLMEDENAQLPTDKYDILRYWIDHKDEAINLKYE
ncbi:MAG: hypothetical protein IKR58_06595 [Lachnospiraceae bacterium]|nr:hypothetical protein [Lachnospiraceae bacterium]